MSSRILIKTAVVCLLAAAAWSQEFRGTISGAVTDPSGASVPGAKVTVTETRTGTRIPTVSDSAGKYTAPFLLPGDYDVVVQADGFKAFTRKGLTLAADDHLAIDVRLEVGNVAQSVEVSGAAPLLDTENSTVGQTVDTKEITDLPVNGRTPMMLAQLAMGVISYYS